MMLGLRKRTGRRRLVYRAPTAAEIASMPFDPPPEKEPEPEVSLLPGKKPTKKRKAPSFKSGFGRSSIIGTPGAKPGQPCGFYGCCGQLQGVDGFTICNTCGNVEEIQS